MSVSKEKPRDRQRCKATRKDGQPCTGPAVVDGFCIGHAPQAREWSGEGHKFSELGRPRLREMEHKRKPGRPRAVPDHLIPKVLSLYREGLGYRAVARELAKESGVLADWSTVRRLIKAVASSGLSQGQ